MEATTWERISLTLYNISGINWEAVYTEYWYGKKERSGGMTFLTRGLGTSMQ
jgi:hypothetical protein